MNFTKLFSILNFKPMRKYFSIFIFLFFVFTVNAQKQFAQKLSDAALSLTKDKVTYDPAYVSIKYPNGDVAADKGVCTDVIIRAYRKLGIDLQKEVHEDMKKNFFYISKKIRFEKNRYQYRPQTSSQSAGFLCKIRQIKTDRSKPRFIHSRRHCHLAASRKFNAHRNCCE